jgi:hypothetical protein
MSELPVVNPMSKANLEKRAVDFLAAYSPQTLLYGTPISIEEFFEFILPEVTNLECRFDDLSHLPGEILGITDAKAGVCLVSKALVDDAQKSDVGRRRLRATIAHECGHAIIHVPQFNEFHSCSISGKPLFRANEKDIPAYKNPEWQAWIFANGLLTPRCVISSLRKEGLSNHKIAERLDVNLAFLNTSMSKYGIQ